MKSIHSFLKSSRRSSLAALCAAAMLCCAGAASATPTLTDGGFENNPLVTIGTVLSDFATHSGKWGHEASVITGAVGPVTPFGNLMLQMSPSGNYTQTGQAIDVSGSIGQVLTFSAWFNAIDIPGAIAGVGLSYYAGNDANSGPLDNLTSTIALNLSPFDWQQQSVSLLVPANATYAFVQVFFDSSTLGNGLNAFGFVDDASLSVPEPGSLALAGLACLVAGSAGSSRRRRAAAEPA